MSMALCPYPRMFPSCTDALYDDSMINQMGMCDSPDDMKMCCTSCMMRNHGRSNQTDSAKNLCNENTSTPGWAKTSWVYNVIHCHYEDNFEEDFVQFEELCSPDSQITMIP